MKIEFKRAMHLLQQAEDVVILTHANPDGDTLGAGYALALALRQRGKRARVINNDGVSAKYAFLAVPDEPADFPERFVISVDVADKKLLGKETEKRYGDRVDLSIDHHGTNKLYAKETYVEPDAASACEVVYLLLLSMNIHITKEIADRLYAGVSTDTGCFCYSNTTPRTHRIAADLIERGADATGINIKMFETKTPGFFRLEQQVLQGMELYFDGRVSVLTITQQMLRDTGCKEEDLDDIVALSRQIEGVRIGLSLKEREDGAFKVSVRTHEEIDAAALCQTFGGGGHKRAAGCQFKCSRAQAVEQLLAVSQQMLSEGGAR